MNLRFRSRKEQLHEELRSHLQMDENARVDRGQSLQEARAAARRDFGNVDLVEQVTRDQWGWRWIDESLRDLRYAVRMLRKQPGFTAAAVLILALGIGCNTAVFSLIEALTLRNLAVPEPQELIRISFGPPGTDGPLSGPMFDRLRERQSAFTDLFAWTNSPMALTERGYSRPIQAAYATGSAFPTLKLKPRLGRLLQWSDDEADNISAGFPAVISEAFWIDNYRGDTAVLGQKIIVNGVPATIVGVMPRSFSGITVDYAPQVVVPFAFDLAVRGKASGRFRPEQTFLFAMGRLQRGVSFKQAEANLTAIAPGVLQDSLPAHYASIPYLRNGRLSLSPGGRGSSPLGALYRTPLWTLQVLVGLLLLICCANLAGLQLSRALSRHRELMVRYAIGAERARLIRQLLTESVLLVLVGASGGVLVAQWMASMMVRYVEQSDFPMFLDLRPNVTVVGWTIGLAALVVLLCGLLPAFNLTRFKSDAVLRGQRGSLGSESRVTMQLLPVQVAFSFLIVSLASVFAVSTAKLLKQDPGFRVAGVTLFGVDMERRPEKGEARLALYRNMLEALRHSPGVERASVLAVRPLGEGGIEESAAAVEGNHNEMQHLFANIVGPDYFKTAGTRVLEGREFTGHDTASAQPSCIVNRAAVRLLFPEQRSIGMHIRSAESKPLHTNCEVVGIVADAKYLSLRQSAPPTLYLPYEQLPSVDPGGFITLSRDSGSAIAAFKSALARFAPDTPLLPPITMQRQLEDSIGQERLLATVSLILGAMALVLTCLGLYALENQRVTRRTAEIGLRMALGARPGQMLSEVLRQGLIVLAAGIPAGLLLALGAAKFVRSLLYATSAFDLRIQLGVIALLVAVGLLAGYLPARRAAGVEPMAALRYE